MASNRFDAHQMVSSMELSVTDAIYALSDIIEAYQSPSHVALLESFRKEHGGNMIKRMQIIYPAAIKLQAQVRTLATLCKISFAKQFFFSLKYYFECEVDQNMRLFLQRLFQNMDFPQMERV